MNNARQFRCVDCDAALGRFEIWHDRRGQTRLGEPGHLVRSADPAVMVWGGRGARPRRRFTEWETEDGRVRYRWDCPCGRTIPVRADRLVQLLTRPGTVLI